MSSLLRGNSVILNHICEVISELEKFTNLNETYDYERRRNHTGN